MRSRFSGTSAALGYTRATTVVGVVIVAGRPISAVTTRDDDDDTRPGMREGSNRTL
jgi:hypothetical protein